MRWFRLGPQKPLDETCHQEDQMSRRLKFPAPASDLQGKVMELEIELYKKIVEIWWASQLAYTSTCQETGTSLLPENRRLCTLDLFRPHSMLFFTRLFIFILYNKAANGNKMTFWVLWTILVNYQSLGWGHGTPQFTGSSVRSIGDPEIATTMWREEQLCGVGPLSCRVCTNSR